MINNNAGSGVVSYAYQSQTGRARVGMMSFPDQDQYKRKNPYIRLATLVFCGLSRVSSRCCCALGLHVRQNNKTPIASEAIHRESQIFCAGAGVIAENRYRCPTPSGACIGPSEVQHGGGGDITAGV